MTARFHLNCRACGARGRSLCAICKAAQTFAGRSGFIPGRKRGARSEARRSLGDPCSPGYLSPFMGRWVFSICYYHKRFCPVCQRKRRGLRNFFRAGAQSRPPITGRGRKATRGARKAAPPYNGARAEGDAGRAVRSRSRRGRRNSDAGNLPAGGRARTGTPPCPRR